MVSTEIVDCPRLFTITSIEATGLSRVRFWQRHYRLVLWCEHPGHWHPWATATYDLDQPKAWLVEVGPYASLVIKTLQTVVPVAASVADVLLSADQLKQAQNEISLMMSLVAAIPRFEIRDREEMIFGTWAGPNQLSYPQGAAARAIRELLLAQDHGRRFGDMRRVIAPSGEFLWVCPEHYANYDPGLPAIGPPASGEE